MRTFCPVWAYPLNIYRSRYTPQFRTRLLSYLKALPRHPYDIKAEKDGNGVLKVVYLPTYCDLVNGRRIK